MKINVDTQELEDYARKIAIQSIRGQVGNLIKGEMDALKNFSDMNQKIWAMQREVNTLKEELTKLKKKWWQKK